MAAPSPDIQAILARRGLPLTPQREAVWRVFEEQQRGLTVRETVDALHANGMTIGQATVYRTISLLEELGLLQRIADESGGAPRFVSCTSGHCHLLLCQSCHAAVEFDACDLSVLERYLAASTGYTISRHHLEMYGLCPSCRTETHAQ